MAGRAHDAMVARLEEELRDKDTFVAGLIERAQAGTRDLTTDERALLVETRSRMESIRDQINEVEDISRVATEIRQRASVVDTEISKRNRTGTNADIQYRSAGSYALDMYGSSLGRRDSAERMEIYLRSADHDKTGDMLGAIPDPIIGEVLNFIDASRPIVSTLGPRPLPGESWHRPKVTQHTAVAKQGVNGAPADEKLELTSQKMVITRLDGNAVTYGGYVNVARQIIDFTTPAGLDAVINDLAANYSIETEAATGDALAAVSTVAVTYDDLDQNTVAAAVWGGAAKVYAATKGQGRLVLAIAPDRLSTFGPLFAPYGPFNQQGQGFSAVNFGQGPMGVISGVPVVMSAGLGVGEAFLLSTSAIEVYEQRIGTLQVTEPSVLGVQVAYAGYFSIMTVESAGIVPLEVSGS